MSHRDAWSHLELLGGGNLVARRLPLALPLLLPQLPLPRVLRDFLLVPPLLLLQLRRPPALGLRQVGLARQLRPQQLILPLLQRPLLPQPLGHLRENA